MKSVYSSSWKGSIQPRKQRKYRYNAPMHVRKKLVSVHLSKELIKKHNKRNLPLIKGDKVKVMRGQFKNKIGIVEKVDKKNLRIYVEGIEMQKKDGSKVKYSIDPSNLLITELKLEDKKRLNIPEVKNGQKSS
tara:strand:+ start:830 stop:1228 length:399 start_codon:yes stop_codon:yes gene_type:complete